MSSPASWLADNFATLVMSSSGSVNGQIQPDVEAQTENRQDESDD
jgi:hypothetical protein